MCELDEEKGNVFLLDNMSDINETTPLSLEVNHPGNAPRELKRYILCVKVAGR